MNKFEWRKIQKEHYLPKKQPSEIEVPSMQYFTIEGSGNHPFKRILKRFMPSHMPLK